MTDEPDLSTLIDDVQSGRDAAFAALVSRVQARVRAWAVRFTQDADAADDVAQEVLIGLERSVRRYQGRSGFSTWLFSVTRNAARNHQRTDVRRMAIHERRGVPASSVAATSDDGHDERTVATLILGYLDALPPQQRRVFELVDLRGLEPVEAARLLDMRPVTARAHLFKARRAIRSHMLDQHEQLMKEFLS